MLNEVGGPIKDMQKNATIFSKHFSRITKNLNLKKAPESLAELVEYVKQSRRNLNMTIFLLNF